jgi:hypothetical protein
VAQQNVHHLRAACTNFAATAIRLVPQAEAMFLDAKEFFVEWENLCRLRVPGGGEFALSVGQNLIEMPGHDFRLRSD